MRMTQKEIDSEIDDITQSLGFCACGAADVALRALRLILRTAQYEGYIPLSGEDMLLANWMTREGLLEHDKTIMFSTLTKKGSLLLVRLNRMRI